MSNYKSTIIAACEKVTAQLPAMASSDISMVLSSEHDLRVANDWHKLDDRLIWAGKPYWESDQSCQFHLSLKRGRAVLGVCKSQIEEQNITMDCFESRPFENPLKGKVLKAFTDAHMLIAKDLSVCAIDVREPNQNAISLLEALGFNTAGHFPVMHLSS